MSAYERILERVAGLRIVDTHEHLPVRCGAREKPTDVLREYLTHYFDKDLISAGMPKQHLAAVRDMSKPLMERWNILEPYFEMCRHTGYGRALEISAQGLYGIERIRRDTIEALNGAFISTLDDPNWFHTVLRDKCLIDTCVLDAFESVRTGRDWFDSTLFTPVMRIDEAVSPGAQWFALLERAMGAPIRSFFDYLDAIDTLIAQAPDFGYVGFKCGLAYQRPLRFERASFAQAEAAFCGMLAKPVRPLWGDETEPPAREFEDYMMHRCLRAIERSGLPLQIHTGLQESSGNRWSNSDPLLLNDLFGQYPGVSFDLFHIGYPNWQSLSALSKNYPNVYIDFCWAHIISPVAAVNALDEYLDSVPRNKLLGFGGDYLMVDPVYGHQIMARENISRALARKVEQGVFGVDQAVYTAQLILRDNPARLFSLKL